MAENGSIKPGIKSSEVLTGLGAMAALIYGSGHEAINAGVHSLASADPKALMAAASAGGPYAIAGVAVAILLSRTIVKVVDRNAQKHENVANQQGEIARANAEQARHEAEKALAELHAKKNGS